MSIAIPVKQRFELAAAKQKKNFRRKILISRDICCMIKEGHKVKMKKNILLVEFNSETIEKVKEVFRQKMFDVAVAGNDEVARKLLSHRQFDLLITETLLPKSHGFILSKFVSETYPKTRIIIMSAKLSAEDYRDDAKKEYGADDFLQKPLDVEELRRVAYKLMKVGDADIATYEDSADMSTNLHILPTLEQLESMKNKSRREDIFGEIIDEVKEGTPYNIDLDDQKE